jgi:K+-transporting ATPase KdpF subunit
MKAKFFLPDTIVLIIEDLISISLEFRQRKWPLRLFLGLCLSVAIAPAVQAATDNTLNRGQSLALTLLGLVTLALTVYLFVVMFQPERF